MKEQFEEYLGINYSEGGSSDLDTEWRIVAKKVTGLSNYFFRARKLL